VEQQGEIRIMLSHIAKYFENSFKRKKNFADWLSFIAKRRGDGKIHY
jgi:hypothetical protein